ncbi:11420_t:CDS:2 [Paraglomus brasilianum]|uniref:11420_t:CDS:1 n=1 Tax=Paraglomus brasilianum TaxID=144538 RepID=A0A9N9AEM3_9GLOM|nr:11420_t:CDS:2 [Paraglomus brasilianum]
MVASPSEINSDVDESIQEMIANPRPSKNEKVFLIKKVETFSQEQVMRTIGQFVTETTFKVKIFATL